MILYKYRSNSDFTDKILIDKRIWLANAANLNDPFECTITEIAKDWIDQKVKELKTAHIEGFIFPAFQSIKNKSNFYDLDPKQTKEFLKKFKEKSFDLKYKTVREFIFRKPRKEISNPEDTFKNFDEQLNQVGIFSLSEVDDNDLMWAHYADSLKGIALGFEVSPGSKLADEEHCLKVNYSDTRPTFSGDDLRLQISFYEEKNVQKIAFIDPTFRQAVSTKKTSWDYEREWRYIEEKPGSYDYPGKLKEIIFGLKCPADKRKNYIELINNHFNYPIDVNEMVIPPKENKLIKQKYRIP